MIGLLKITTAVFWVCAGRSWINNAEARLLSKNTRRIFFSNRSQWPRRLMRESRSFACWDCGFESRRGDRCLSLVSAVCCQVEIFVTDRSPIKRIASAWGVFNWVWLKNLTVGSLGPQEQPSHDKNKKKCCLKMNMLIAFRDTVIASSEK